jgi:hypothetical protein
MKKIVLLVVMVFAFAYYPNAIAQTWHTANQATIAWDAVAKIVDTDTIRYQVYTRTGTTGDGSPVGSELTATQLLISFAVEGRYFFGVETIRYPAGETIGIRSQTKAWSNVAANCGPSGPFGVVYYIAPATPAGLRRVP